MTKYISSESVGIGHPDKICDQIADRILVECLKQDKHAKVACEVFASNQLIVVGGEITTKGYVDIVQAVWDVLKPLGYDEHDFKIIININSQSPEITQLVEKNHTINAGDQGLVFGYATNETKNYMPLAYVIATDLVQKCEQLIRTKKLPDLKFDMKSEVILKKDDDKYTIEKIIMSIQHHHKANLKSLKNDLWKHLVLPIIKAYDLNTDFEFRFNYGGHFIIGGPIADSGLTGRKIMVDSYGCIAHHGGGAFSGKDYTKVDRTGAYFARYIAKNIVASKLADQCEVELTYEIGNEQPIAMNIEAFGTNHYSMKQIINAVKKSFNFKLTDIVKKFQLDKFDYTLTSVYGHFGKPKLPWEKLDKATSLKHFLTNKC